MRSEVINWETLLPALDSIEADPKSITSKEILSTEVQLTSQSLKLVPLCLKWGVRVCEAFRYINRGLQHPVVSIWHLLQTLTKNCTQWCNLHCTQRWQIGSYKLSDKCQCKTKSNIKTNYMEWICSKTKLLNQCHSNTTDEPNKSWYTVIFLKQFYSISWPAGGTEALYFWHLRLPEIVCITFGTDIPPLQSSFPNLGSLIWQWNIKKSKRMKSKKILGLNPGWLIA